MSKHYVIHTLLLFLSTLFLKSNPISFVKELDIGASARLTYDSNIFGVSKDVFQNANRTQEEVVSKMICPKFFSCSPFFKDIYLKSQWSIGYLLNILKIVIKVALYVQI